MYTYNTIQIYISRNISRWYVHALGTHPLSYSASQPTRMRILSREQRITEQTPAKPKEKYSKNRERMREWELVVGSKFATSCNSTHSRDTWHVGVASGSISSWFLKFCDSCRDSIGAYNTVITRRPRVDSRRESFYRSGLFYYSNPGKLEKRTISVRRETRQIAGNDLQSKHILNKLNSAQQRKCGLGANGRHYDAMCVSWSLSNLTILLKKKRSIPHTYKECVIFNVSRAVWTNNYRSHIHVCVCDIGNYFYIY